MFTFCNIFPQHESSQKVDPIKTKHDCGKTIFHFKLSLIFQYLRKFIVVRYIITTSWAPEKVSECLSKLWNARWNFKRTKLNFVKFKIFHPENQRNQKKNFCETWHTLIQKQSFAHFFYLDYFSSRKFKKSPTSLCNTSNTRRNFFNKKKSQKLFICWGSVKTQTHTSSPLQVVQCCWRETWYFLRHPTTNKNEEEIVKRKERKIREFESPFLTLHSD